MPELDAARVWTEMQPQVTAAMYRFKRHATANGGTHIRLYSQALYLTPHRPTSSGDCYGLAVRWCLCKLNRGPDILTATLAAASTASEREDTSQFTSPVTKAVDAAQSHQYFRHDSEESINAYIARAPNETEAARVWLNQGLRRQTTHSYRVAVVGPARAATFITSATGAYMITLPTHAVAAVHDGVGTWYFDPNFGEAYFVSAGGFRSFLGSALKKRQRHGQLRFSVDRYTPA